MGYMIHFQQKWIIHEKIEQYSYSTLLMYNILCDDELGKSNVLLDWINDNIIPKPYTFGSFIGLSIELSKDDLRNFKTFFIKNYKKLTYDNLYKNELDEIDKYINSTKKCYISID